jgi:hypothetical protein
MNKYIKLLGIKSIFLFTLTSGNSAFADIKAAVAGYKARGAELMTMINSGKVDAAKAEKLVDEIAGFAKTIAEDFAKKDPKATKLVKFIIDATPNYKKMSAEAIEKDYHDGKKIDPKVVGLDITKEENEKYTDPIHCYLHPFMTLAAIKANDLKTAKEELNEGIEQAAKAGEG